MEPELLARTLCNFLSDSRDAVVVEDGAVTFELAQARYSVSAETGKCVLHLWSQERNAVRRVVDLETKNGVLRLSALRFGQTRPARLEIRRDRDARTVGAKRLARSAYEQRLKRVLQREFPVFSLPQFSSAMDLERSFGPAYARGLLKRGQSTFAIVGVNSDETQSTVDAALTCGILWLDACRQSECGRVQVEGLKLFAPRQKVLVLRERMAHLNRGAAKWQLYELDEREETIQELDTSDCGNLATRLLHCWDLGAVRERFASQIEHISSYCPDAETTVISPAEISFRFRGLEFAHARLAPAASFRNQQELAFGIGGAETVLHAQNGEELASLVEVLTQTRHPHGPRDHPMWRMHPERWLESLVVHHVSQVEERLQATPVYSQVPAFSASDRAMIDVLAATNHGRLAVLELKADEAVQLPLQGLDYWARVGWHHARGEFNRLGYFPGRELSPDPPLLIFVAPALHIHPATDTLLRYLSPRIDWMVAGIDEHWREGVRVVFRKRPENLSHTIAGRHTAAAG